MHTDGRTDGRADCAEKPGSNACGDAGAARAILFMAGAPTCILYVSVELGTAVLVPVVELGGEVAV